MNTLETSQVPGYVLCADEPSQQAGDSLGELEQCGKTSEIGPNAKLKWALTWPLCPFPALDPQQEVLPFFFEAWGRTLSEQHRLLESLLGLTSVWTFRSPSSAPTVVCLVFSYKSRASPLEACVPPKPLRSLLATVVPLGHLSLCPCPHSSGC